MYLGSVGLAERRARQRIMGPSEKRVDNTAQLSVKPLERRDPTEGRMRTDAHLAGKNLSANPSCVHPGAREMPPVRDQIQVDGCRARLYSEANRTFCVHAGVTVRFVYPLSNNAHCLRMPNKGCNVPTLIAVTAHNELSTERLRKCNPRTDAAHTELATVLVRPEPIERQAWKIPPSPTRPIRRMVRPDQDRNNANLSHVFSSETGYKKP
jgi:hypothetical protein